MMPAIWKLLGLPFEFWALLVTWLPGPVGRFLRFHYWKRRLKELGPDTLIDVGVYIQRPEYVRVGRHAWIDRNVHILAGPPHGERLTHVKENADFEFETGEVVIGDNTHIAPFCVLSGIGGIQIGDCITVAAGSKVYSFSHHYRNLDDRADQTQYSFTSLARPDQQAMVAGPVVLMDHAAIGLGSIVLPGVTIGRGSWVASGMVVSTDVPDQTLAYQQREVRFKSLGHLEIRT